MIVAHVGIITAYAGIASVYAGTVSIDAVITLAYHNFNPACARIVSLHAETIPRPRHTM